MHTRSLANKIKLREAMIDEQETNPNSLYWQERAGDIIAGLFAAWSDAETWYDETMKETDTCKEIYQKCADKLKEIIDQ
jgi:hypothetical protein